MPDLNHPALVTLKSVEKRHPNIWSVADDLQAKFTAGKHREGCIFSAAEANLLNQKLTGEGNDGFHPDLLGALVAWRPTKGIYRFHPSLYESLIDTDLEGDVPSDVLLRLPGWAVFIETPPSVNMPFPIQGFWAYLSRLGKQDELELVGLWRPGANFQGGDIDPDRDVLCYSLPLGSHPVSDLVQMQFERSAREQGKEPREFAEEARLIIEHQVSAMLSLLLYLCSEQPDITDWDPPVPAAKYFGTKRRWMSAKVARQWEVGIRLGAALDLAAEATGDEQAGVPGSGSPVRPHIRRAHWHSFWVGKRGEQTISLRWLPPIPVKIDGEPLPAVIHPVHDGKGATP